MSMLIAIFLNSFNIPSFNNQLGFREISKNGIELSKKTNINKFATLDMGRTENMSVYLNTEIIKIKKLDSLRQSVTPPYILFTKKRVREKYSEVQTWLNDKDGIRNGKYEVYIIR